MITLVVGHRGTGKSLFLQRYATYFPEVQILDLDACVERFCQKTIPQIFRDDGEAVFRAFEHDVFKKLLSKISPRVPTLIALGAGFSGDLPPELEVLWLRRTSDRAGRIFADRPRLSPDKRPLEEWDHFFAQRESRYAEHATATWTMPEGLGTQANDCERDFLQGKVNARGASLSLLPAQFVNPVAFARWAARHRLWNFSKFELRLDLLSGAEISLALKCFTRAELLMSFRTEQLTTVTPLKGLDYDWDITLGAPSFGQAPAIVSQHRRQPSETLRECARALSEFKVQHRLPDSVLEKLSIEVDSLQELRQGREWVNEAPQRRAFFARSKEGSLAWFRLQHANPNGFNFIRESSGTSLDQPTLYEWMACVPEAKRFAAVLGEPVEHSFSPLMHREFFRKRGMNVHAVSLGTRETSDSGALAELRQLGLESAAVTSPLKPWALSVAGIRSAKSAEFQMANTLLLADTVSGTKAALTDYAALQAFLKNNGCDPSSSVVVGAGSMGTLVCELLPQVLLIGARDESLAAKLQSCGKQTLIWASGSARNFKELPELPTSFKQVVDLNYREDSAGRELAQRHAIPYVSGLEFFYAQAELQQIIWSTQDVTTQQFW